MNRVLFACVHNSGRSQIAEAFAKHFFGGCSGFHSAGTRPVEAVNPLVVTVMNEKGIDISCKRPKLLTREMISQVDRVIAMGCSVEEACPVVNIPVEDWDLDDPAGKSIEDVRKIRDQVEDQVKNLFTQISQR